VVSFKGDYKKFSNFYPCIVHYEGFNFATVEHAYVAAKTQDRMFRSRIAQLLAEEAGLAKKMGRSCTLRRDWDLMKVSVMYRLLMQKFSYDEFKSLLISTGDVDIIEGNYWHDNFWGNCFCKKCVNIPGKNQLGKLLMKIRRIV